MVSMSSQHQAPNRDEGWAIGCTVRLVTILDEVVEGTVFAFDRLSNCLTLTNEGVETGTSDFRVLKASCIKSILSASLPEAPVQFSLPYVDLTADSQQPEPSPQIRDEESLPVTNWEDEVAREEKLSVDREEKKVDRQSPWGRPKPVKDPEPLDPPAERKSVWANRPKTEVRETDVAKEVEQKSATSYASVSKGNQAPMPAVLQPAPKGPWGAKNPRITSRAAYSQVVASNSNTEQANQQDQKPSNMLTMSLKNRTAMRN